MLRKIRFLAPLALLSVLLAACEPASQPTRPPSDPPSDQPVTQETDWGKQVAAIAAGQTDQARRQTIENRLQTLGLTVEKQAFESGFHDGVNLLAYVGGPEDAPLLLIGAHYDRVDVGHGATDNASGVATVLALAEALHAKPLNNHRVVVAFWGKEEDGLLGSRHWVKTATEAPALYINFDVFGWGDTLWMMAPEPNMPIAEAVRKAAENSGINTSIGKDYPPTDHLAFLHAGLPAVSFSLIDSKEIPLTLQVFSGERPDSMPKVIKTIHSDNDGMQAIVEQDAVNALPILEKAIRSWDAAAQ